MFICTLFTSCSQDEQMVTQEKGNSGYEVTILCDNLALTRAGATDLVQGAGRYPEGEKVTLHTSSRKFMANANGSAGGSWAQSGNPAIQTVLSTGINQDWTVTIKYYCDVTMDCTAPGGDGTKTTKSLEVGSTLPTPAVSSGYKFDGWYDGNTKVTVVPESSNRTLTAKFNLNVQNIIIRAILDKTGYYLLASSAVQTDITSQIETYWYEETINPSTGETEHFQDGTSLYDITIPKGKTKSNIVGWDATGSGAFSSNEEFTRATHSWNNISNNGYRYVLGENAWK